jgi:phosphoribosyl-ATP pyrophosphohydrolase/phosphoribosyl-AMP cyclohydrolase
MISLKLESLKFGPDGLIPAVIQDANTKNVIMFAWMSKESLQMSLELGETVFFSRSRSKLWHKGATSGNSQVISTIEVDCDSDVLLINVEPKGPACHRGTVSCFDSQVIGDIK